MGFFRSFFGLEKSSEKRTVVGQAVGVDAKDVQYIQNSNARLARLHTLCGRYKDTPHAAKLEAVFEQTKQIHHFLLTRKRAHELELFHVRHTDHFLNTFTVIVDVYQRQNGTLIAPPRPEPQRVVRKPEVVSPRPVQPAPRPAQPAPRPADTKIEDVLRRIETETVRGIQTAQKVTDMVKRVAGQVPSMQADAMRPPVPTVSVPIISIDTYSKITYTRKEADGEVVSGQIGFTSSEEEMETFLLHLAEQQGINREMISYMGNAMIAIPDRKGPNPARYVPVINWKGCAYGLNLNDYRLFPVRTYKRSS